MSSRVTTRCWANLRRHTSLLARRQASTYTHVRLGLPTSLAPCLARNLTQHRPQIDPLPTTLPSSVEGRGAVFRGTATESVGSMNSSGNMGPPGYALTFSIARREKVNAYPGGPMLPEEF